MKEVKKEVKVKETKKTSCIKCDCENDKFGNGVSFDLLEKNKLNPQDMNSEIMSELLGLKVKTVRIDNSLKAVFIIEVEKK